MASILVVEDDLRIRTSLVQRLAERGHFVDSTDRGLEAVERSVKGGFDVLVLDLGLPDLDGAQVLHMIRAVSAVPIIVATARDEESQIVQLLDAGADDYLVKPFSADQLEARVRAILRRKGEGGVPTVYEYSGLRIDLAARTAILDGADLELTPKEFDFLAYLAEHSGQVVSKRDILANVWRQPYGGADKTVDVHLSWLRKKLGESASEPRFLHTRRGVGVIFIPPKR